MAFSKAFDNNEHSSVSLKESETGSLASIVSWISDCFAFAVKADKIKLTVSFSQKRVGVMASMSDWAVRRYSLICSICPFEAKPCKRDRWWRISCR